jgi:ribonuclease D
VDLDDLCLERGYECRDLRSLYGFCFERQISIAMQHSNWARVQLSREQIESAATDAWASRRLGLQLLEEIDAVEQRKKGPTLQSNGGHTLIEDVLALN